MSCETAYIEKSLSAEDPIHFEPLSTDTLEELVRFISLNGVLSDKVEKNDFVEQQGFGWVKTFHVLITLCNLAMRHESFNEERAKVIFTECLKNLLSQGLDMNAPLLWQGTKPLHWAAGHGCATLCNVLVNLGANIEELRDASYGKTPLHIAVSAEKINAVRELIKLGANVNATAKENNSGRAEKPIHKAAYNAEIIQLLWENGADINAISMDTTYGPAPLYKAVKGGQPEATRKLLELGATVNTLHYEILRKALVKNVHWHLGRFGCPENDVEAWASFTAKIAKYVSTLIVLNNHQFCSRPQSTLKFNELYKVNPKVDMSYDDWVQFISTIKDINKELLNQNQCEASDYWTNKAKLLFDHTTSLIEGVKKYV